MNLTSYEQFFIAYSIQSEILLSEADWATSYTITAISASELKNGYFCNGWAISLGTSIGLHCPTIDIEFEDCRSFCLES